MSVHALSPLQSGYQDEISDVVRSLTTPGIIGALVLGASGMGKTTVVNAALSSLEASVPVHRFRGSNLLSTRDLGIFEVLLSQSHGARELAPGASLSVVRSLLRPPAEGVLPVVLIDNADRVDEHSLSVLTQLAAAGLLKVVVIAATIAPPVDLVADLWAAGQMIRVDLDGIDERAIAAMTEDSGVDLDAATIADYRRRSGGNPRLLRSLITDQVRTTGARRGAESRVLWNISGPQRRILSILALATAFPYESLMQLCDPELVDDLDERGVVAITRGRSAEVTVADPAVAATLRDAIQPSQRLQLWQEVAPVLEQRGVRGRSLFGLISWGQRVGFRQDARQVLEAGLWANGEGEYSDAATVLRGAHSVDPEIRLEMARAELGCGREAEAMRIFDELVTSVSASNCSETFASRLACMDLRLTDPRRPEDLRADWARELLTTSSDRGRLDVTRARFDINGGRIDEARALAESVYRDHACLTRHRLRACATLGVSEVLSGRIGTGLDYLRQAELMFALPGMTSFEVEDAVPQIFTGRYLAGEWNGARAALGRLTPRQAIAEAAAAIVDLRSGRIALAKQILERELSRNRSAAITDLSGIARSALAWADGLLRLHDDAERRILTPSVLRSGGREDRTPSIPVGPKRLGPRSPDGAGAGTEPAGIDRDFTWHRSNDARIYDLLALGLTDPRAAAAGLHRLGGETAALGAFTFAIRAWMEACRYGSEESPARLAEAARRVDGRRGALAASVAAAFGGTGSMFSAAQEALDCGEVVMCADLARMARDQAVAAGDAAEVRRARALMESAMRTIIFGTQGGHLKGMLNDVERSLVDGVADSVSNAQLGRDLHLSVRTVEWHLGRLYRRLHVANRNELRLVMREWAKR